MSVIQSLNQAAANVLDLDGIKKIKIGDFTMFAQTKRAFTLASDVPTSPLEDGTEASDHIILKPIPITIEGNVSDVFIERDPFKEAFQRARAEVGNITKYLPSRTQTQLSKANEFIDDASQIARTIDTAVADGQQALEFFGLKDPGTPIRQKFVDEMLYLYYSKQLVSIQMPFVLFGDMRITNVVITEDNQTEELKFSLTAVEIQKVETTFTDISQFFKNPSTGTNGQLDGVKDKAAQAGSPVEESFLTTVKGLF